MKTVKELKKWLMPTQENLAYYKWYEYAIQELLLDIKNSEVISVDSIEKWLELCLDDNDKIKFIK